MALEVVMPDAEELMRRLMGVDDNRHLVENFYPIVARSLANKRQDGVGVVRVLLLAIADYSDGAQAREEQILRIGRFNLIKAMLVEGQAAIKADAMRYLESLIRLGL